MFKFNGTNSFKFETEPPVNDSNKRKKKTKSEMLEENFLFHMGQQNASCADFDKIEKHYINKLIETNKKYNNNKIIIQEKNIEYESVNSKLIELIKNYYIFSESSQLKNYEKKIEEYKKKIKEKEHELECYQHSYSRLYKTNYLIKRRFEREMKLENIFEKQEEKYQILNKNAVKVLTNQITILNILNKYHQLSKEKKQKQIQKKLNKLSHLESAVADIKHEISQTENDIYTVKTRQNSIIEEMSFRKKLNVKLTSELVNVKKENWELKKKFLKLFMFYDRVEGNFEKNMKDIIDMLKERQMAYMNYTATFNEINQKIEALNSELFDLDVKKTDIQRRIKMMKKSMEKKSLTTMNIKTQFILIKAQFQKTSEELIEKKLIIKNAFSFMCTKIEKIKQFLNFKEEENPENHLTNKTLFKEGINIFDIKYCTFLILNFHFFTCKSLIHTANKIAEIYINKTQYEPQKKFELIDLNSNKKFKSFYEMKLQDNLIRLENKISLINRKNSLLKNILPREPIQMRKINRSEQKKFLSSYENFINLTKNDKLFSRYAPRKSLEMIDGYVNFHSSDEIITKQRNFAKLKTQFRIKKVEVFTENYKELTVDDEDKTVKKRSLTQTKKVKYKKRRNIRNKGFRSKNSKIQLYKDDYDLSKIFSRSNDLRNLELLYYKGNKEIDLTNQEFGLICQKIKKDFTKKLFLKSKKDKSTLKSFVYFPLVSESHDAKSKSRLLAGSNSYTNVNKPNLFGSNYL